MCNFLQLKKLVPLPEFLWLITSHLSGGRFSKDSLILTLTPKNIKKRFIPVFVLKDLWQLLHWLFLSSSLTALSFMMWKYAYVVIIIILNMSFAS